jgi:hypothetical protein
VTITDDSIDRQSAEPYYQQSAQVLESRIASGTIERGARLPSGLGKVAAMPALWQTLEISVPASRLWSASYPPGRSRG